MTEHKFDIGDEVTMIGHRSEVRTVHGYVYYEGVKYYITMNEEGHQKDIVSWALSKAYVQ